MLKYLGFKFKKQFLQNRGSQKAFFGFFCSFGSFGFFDFADFFIFPVFSRFFNFFSVSVATMLLFLGSISLALFVPQNLYASNAEIYSETSPKPLNRLNELQKNDKAEGIDGKDEANEVDGVNIADVANKERTIEDFIESEPDITDIKENSAFDVFKKSSNVVYQFMGNNEYLSVPISGVAAGMIRCGLWCAALGGIAGIIDELSVYLELTDKRYLTWGILGLTTGHVINKYSYASDIVGVVVGILLPTGTLKDHQELIAPAVSMIAGNSIAGQEGSFGFFRSFGIIGGAAGIVDEILLNNDIEDKHYLTWGTVGIAVANLLKPGFNPVITDAIGAALGMIAAGYEKEISANLLAPVETASSLYETYAKFIPKKELDNHIERHILTLIGNQFLTQFLSLRIMEYQQKLIYNFERLDNPTGSAWGNFRTEMANFAIFLFPYAIGQSFSSNIDHYFDKKFHVALEDQIKTKLFSGETMLRLSHDKNNTVLLDNLREDVSTVVNSGSGLIASAISTSVGGAYGVGIVIVHSPNIFVYSVLYNKAQAFVAEYLASQRRAYGEKIRILDSKLVTTLKHDAENIRIIVERDGTEAMKEKIQQISHDLRELEGSRKLWSMMNNLWWSTLGTIDYVLNYFLVGREVNRGRIPFEDRNKVQIANWQTSSLLSWSGHQAQTLSEIKQSLDRVIILEGKIHSLPEDQNRVDQINRKIKKGDQLIFKDLEVGFGDKVLVSIEDLKLDMGKVYAITGKSECGKTSFLSKIKGIKENGVFGKGFIYYPEIEGKAPKIVMLSQQDYFPLDSSLYEIIFYPDKTPNDSVSDNEKKEKRGKKEKRAKIALLLEKIGLDAFSTDVVNDEKLNLDSKKDWYKYLSGGGKKKVMLVSAIIKKPDILILDEIFSGLDEKSIAIAQQMLKKHLPKTMILSVDHHAQDNNHGGFYDNELRFFNKNIILQKMDEKKI